MDSGVWMHATVIVVAVDMAVFLGCLAMIVDHHLLNTDRRWQFGLGSLFIAMTLTVINVAVFAGLMGR